MMTSNESAPVEIVTMENRSDQSSANGILIIIPS